ncbi:MAG TPA: ABC transporter permease [Candidatus Saccharimonadales bacterium]|jgi:putative ABC transport system permease protein|nr:ABC transporter permease [Candidatus Saccharimonadales bacterium]
MVQTHMLFEDVKMALETIWNHKVRSLLTVLGVVIGTMVAIVVASILLGVQKNIQDSLNEFGVDNLFIFKFDAGIHFGRISPEERTRRPMTFEDGTAIKEDLPLVKNVVVEALPRFGPQTPRTARNKNHELTNLVFRGVTASYSEVVNGKMREGRFFTDIEDLHREEAVVLGFDAEKALFPDERAEGHQLLVDGNLYTVMGVFEKKKNTFNQGGDVEVLVPYRTYRKHYPSDDENLLIVMAAPNMKKVAEDQVRGLLRTRRRVPPNKPDNFGISSAEELGNQFADIMAKVLQYVIGVVSVGLLVGGVGVMNIMLMSVTERTREIGVRKAIGARRRDISFQFMVEAVTLTGIGGMLGVLLSLAASFLMQLAHFPSSVPMWAVLVAVGVSGGVGLFFGIYPAVKAASLDPVEALRYE